MLILLSGFMIGSTLFAVPKKQTDDLSLMVLEWIFARPLEGAGAEYYRRMETKAQRCMSIRMRYDYLTLRERRVRPPRRKRVSGVFLSLLRYYLPDNNNCPNAKLWRRRIATMMRDFQSGQIDIAEIETIMDRFCVRANRDEIVFAHHANGCIVLNLVLYELERLVRIVR